MPQLDKMTWLGQVVWFLVSFGALYLYLAKTGLPSLARLLKVRGRMVQALMATPAAATGGQGVALDPAVAGALIGTHAAVEATAGQAGGASAPAVSTGAAAWRVLAPAAAAGTAAAQAAHGVALADTAFDPRRRAALAVAAEAALGLMAQGAPTGRAA
jgi:hypothetical protein